MSFSLSGKQNARLSRRAPYGHLSSAEEYWLLPYLEMIKQEEARGYRSGSGTAYLGGSVWSEDGAPYTAV